MQNLMQLGERIEERLGVLGISQAELARRARVPQTTINGLIRGTSRMSPHLVKIASELKTTPAYLTGETDNPKAELPDFPLSSDEREGVEILRGLHRKHKEAILHLTRALSAAPLVENVEPPESPERP